MTLATDFGTADRIIRMAALDAQLIARGQSVSSDLYQEMLNRLNDIINLEQTQGLKLWLYQDTSVTLTAGTALYTFGPTGTVVMVKPLRVIQAYFLDSSDNKTPLFPLSWQEYLNLSNSANTGTISQYLVDKQKDTLNVTFWMVPDVTAATGTVHLLFELQATNPVLLTDNVGFPPEWYIFLRWALASDSASSQPAEVQQRCSTNASLYREALEAWDVEDAPTQFQPDMTRGTASRGFR